MFKIVETVERTIIKVLIGMMMFVVILGMANLGMILVKEFLNPPKFLFDLKNLLNIFGFFFMILIGLELLETIKTYLTNDQIHVEIVFLVAMIAVARKVIILDINSLSALTLVGIATIIVALASGYFLVKLTHRKNQE